MGENEERKTFGRNLTYYINKSGKDQVEVAKDLGFAPTTFNTWCTGKIIPSMGKVQQIADYFGIGKSDLIDSHDDNGYYFDKKTAKVAQEMFENPELRVLFDAARDATPEDLKVLYDMALALKRKERHDTDN